MKYFTLVAMLAAATTATSCCHSRYTQAHIPSTLLFYVNDEVKLSAASSACQNMLHICKDSAVIADISDRKNQCYPQATYYVKFYHHLDTYAFCAADLILVKEGT